VGIINRRNAAISWLTWVVTKRVVKKKAKDAVPAIDPQSKKPNRSALALLLAGAAGALAFRRKRSGDG
jgi:MYXO-CTERM domain-containing protein